MSVNSIESIVDRVGEIYERFLTKEVDGFTFDRWDDDLGQVWEEVIILPPEERRQAIKLCFERIAAKLLPLPPLLRQMFLPIPSTDIDKVADYFAHTQQADVKQLARDLIAAFTPSEIRKALVDSLKYARIDILDRMKSASKTGKVKIKGHQSCVFMQFDGDTIRVG